jgi:hypothetical protein
MDKGLLDIQWQAVKKQLEAADPDNTFYLMIIPTSMTKEESRKRIAFIHDWLHAVAAVYAKDYLTNTLHLPKELIELKENE